MLSLARSLPYTNLLSLKDGLCAPIHKGCVRGNLGAPNCHPGLDGNAYSGPVGRRRQIRRTEMTAGNFYYSRLLEAVRE